MSNSQQQKILPSIPHFDMYNVATSIQQMDDAFQSHHYTLHQCCNYWPVLFYLPQALTGGCKIMRITCVDANNLYHIQIELEPKIIKAATVMSHCVISKMLVTLGRTIGHVYAIRKKCTGIATIINENTKQAEQCTCELDSNNRITVKGKPIKQEVTCSTLEFLQRFAHFDRLNQLHFDTKQVTFELVETLQFQSVNNVWHCSSVKISFFGNTAPYYVQFGTKLLQCETISWDGSHSTFYNSNASLSCNSNTFEWVYAVRATNCTLESLWNEACPQTPIDTKNRYEARWLFASIAATIQIEASPTWFHTYTATTPFATCYWRSYQSMEWEWCYSAHLSTKNRELVPSCWFWYKPLTSVHIKIPILETCNAEQIVWSIGLGKVQPMKLVWYPQRNGSDALQIQVHEKIIATGKQTSIFTFVPKPFGDVCIRK